MNRYQKIHDDINDLHHWGFFKQDCSLYPMGYRMLVAMKNTRIDQREQSLVILKVIEDHIRMGELTRTSARFIFDTAVFVGDHFELSQVELNHITENTLSSISNSLEDTLWTHTSDFIMHDGQMLLQSRFVAPPTFI
jgi:hypothetical protein